MTGYHDRNNKQNSSEDHVELPQGVDGQGHGRLVQAVDRLAEYIRAKPHSAHMARALTCMILGEYRGTTEEHYRLMVR